jgi:putative restriction endonuclease
MTKAVFTHSESSAYDDQPELHYHFPRTYLRQVTAAVGDWVVYYEPRRTTGLTSDTGRQAYFAIARVDRVEPDPGLADHFYAHVSGYVELDTPVPFRSGYRFYESALAKPDGSTNRGAFGRAVRTISDLEFAAIVVAGFTRTLSPWETPAASTDVVPEMVERPTVTQVLERPFRDAAFRRHVRRAYDNTCAVTGLRLLNGGGRPEVQAAHIRPVEEGGPDTVRNGIALTGTVHWLFDRGLISFDDSYRVLVAPELPKGIRSLIRDEHRLLIPHERDLQPHPTYLRWHRSNRFKS